VWIAAGRRRSVMGVPLFLYLLLGPHRDGLAVVVDPTGLARCCYDVGPAQGSAPVDRRHGSPRATSHLRSQVSSHRRPILMLTVQQAESRSATVQWHGLQSGWRDRPLPNTFRARPPKSIGDSTAMCAVYHPYRWWTVVWTCSASGSIVEITRSGATSPAIRPAPRAGTPRPGIDGRITLCVSQSQFELCSRCVYSLIRPPIQGAYIRQGRLLTGLSCHASLDMWPECSSPPWRRVNEPDQQVRDRAV
jgi:hypothetical protein